MAVSKKHFVALAKIMAAIPDRTQARMVAVQVAEMFAEENPRFDRERFLAACGVS